MRAGQLRHLVTIQTLTETNNEGNVSKYWTNTGTAYAAIEPMSGDEKQQYQYVDGETYYNITLRYQDINSTDNRIVFDGKVFHLKNVINHDLRNVMTTCAAVTRDGD
ncbi:phage head closure protein [bacterium]|nr:phage head closure protein [bacterium]MDB4793020.1 phage head closure protein [bacterium]